MAGTHIRTDAAHLQLLQLWFSPAMPTGAYSYSHGLESAIETGDVTDASSAATWIQDVLRYGGPRNDAIFVAAAWQRVRDSTAEPVATALDEVDALARALVAGRERLEETLAQGEAFTKAVHAWARDDDPALRPVIGRTLPVAIGEAAGRFGLPLQATLVASLQATVSNLIWIAARLVPFGQQAALDIVASSMRCVRDVAGSAAHSTLADLHSGALLADIGSLAHESQYARICRT